MGHNKRPATLPLGTLSEGTLRAEDLIDSLTWEMDRIRMSRADRNEYRSILANLVTGDPESESESLDALTAIGEHYTPDYAYLGMHEGDGALFGVWVSREVFEDFDGLKVSDLSEVPSTYSGHVLNVNDHGNATLYSHYRGRFTEVWAIV